MLKNGYLLTMADSFNNGIISETLFFRFETNAVTLQNKKKIFRQLIYLLNVKKVFLQCLVLVILRLKDF
jgi:hypothetical protein